MRSRVSRFPDCQTFTSNIPPSAPFDIAREQGGNWRAGGQTPTIDRRRARCRALSLSPYPCWLIFKKGDAGPGVPGRMAQSADDASHTPAPPGLGLSGRAGGRATERTQPSAPSRHNPDASMIRICCHFCLTLSQLNLLLPALCISCLRPALPSRTRIILFSVCCMYMLLTGVYPLCRTTSHLFSSLPGLFILLVRHNHTGE